MIVYIDYEGVAEAIQRKFNRPAAMSRKTISAEKVSKGYRSLVFTSFFNVMFE
jgi:hypothetical protein